MDKCGRHADVCRKMKPCNFYFLESHTLLFHSSSNRSHLSFWYCSTFFGRPSNYYHSVMHELEMFSPLLSVENRSMTFEKRQERIFFPDGAMFCIQEDNLFFSSKLMEVHLIFISIYVTFKSFAWTTLDSWMETWWVIWGKKRGSKQIAE